MILNCGYASPNRRCNCAEVVVDSVSAVTNIEGNELRTPRLGDHPQNRLDSGNGKRGQRRENSFPDIDRVLCGYADAERSLIITLYE